MRIRGGVERSGLATSGVSREVYISQARCEVHNGRKHLGERLRASKLQREAQREVELCPLRESLKSAQRLTRASRMPLLKVSPEHPEHFEGSKVHGSRSRRFRSKGTRSLATK